jgi:transposase
MIKIDFTDTDRQLLHQERYHHPHPRVMQKMEVLYLKSLGLSHHQICLIAGVCGNTMCGYFKQYIEGGIERLKEVNFHKPNSELKEYSGSIESYFTEHPPVSIAEASEKIEQLTGIKRGETQTRKFMKSLKFRFIKTGSVPAKALTEGKKTNNANFWQKTSTPD